MATISRNTEDAKAKMTHRIGVRFTAQEYEKIHVMMAKYGYNTISAMLRDVLFKKRIVSRKIVTKVTDKVLSDKLNQFLYQANKIGVNYNQLVATYQRQAKMVGPDGKSFLSGRLIEGKIDSLMKLTEEMRDEIAVIIDIFERYTQDN